MGKNLDRIIRESVDSVLAEARGYGRNGNYQTWVGIYNVLRGVMSEMNGMYSKKRGNVSVDDLTYALRKINSGLKSVPKPTGVGGGRMHPYRIERARQRMNRKYYAQDARKGPYGGQAPVA